MHPISNVHCVFMAMDTKNEKQSTMWKSLTLNWINGKGTFEPVGPQGGQSWKAKGYR